MIIVVNGAVNVHKSTCTNQQVFSAASSAWPWIFPSGVRHTCHASSMKHREIEKKEVKGGRSGGWCGGRNGGRSGGRSGWKSGRRSGGRSKEWRDRKERDVRINIKQGGKKERRRGGHEGGTRGGAIERVDMGEGR